MKRSCTTIAFLALLFFMTHSMQINAQANQHTLSWVYGIGGNSLDDVRSTTTDATGNVYIAGNFQGTADFDPGSGTENLTATGQDIFIVKYDMDGNYLWASCLVGDNIGFVTNIAIDQSGNIMLVGSFLGTVDFDPGPDVSNHTSANFIGDMFMAKYDSNGVYMWSKAVFSAGFGVQATVLELDTLGNIITGGLFVGPTDFDAGTGTAVLTPSGLGLAIFIAKYDTDGNYIWAKGFGGGSFYMDATSLSLGDQGDIYLTGVFANTIDFDPGVGVADLVADEPDIICGYLAKYDADGDYVWAKRIDLLVQPYAVDVDDMNDIYLTGRFSGTRDFDPGPAVADLMSNGIEDIFIAKYNAAGSYIWANHIGGATYSWGRCIKIDPAGKIYVTGEFSGTADFDPGPATANLISNGNSDVFIANFDTSGNYLWAGNMGGMDVDQGMSLTTNHAGIIYTTGTYTNLADFDPGSGTSALTSNGDKDVYILKLKSCNDYLTRTEVACDSFHFNDITYLTSGVYTSSFTNTAGCDSVVTLQLTVNNAPDAVITQTGTTLTAGTADTYQWLNCADNFSPIAGATSQEFIPAASGDYAVMVTTNACTDTSDCIAVDLGNHIQELGQVEQIRVYPNPANRLMTIETTVPFHNASIKLVNLLGQCMLTQTGLSGSIFLLNLEQLPEGMYVVAVSESGKTIRKKILKH